MAPANNDSYTGVTGQPLYAGRTAATPEPASPLSFTIERRLMTTRILSFIEIYNGGAAYTRYQNRLVRFGNGTTSIRVGAYDGTTFTGASVGFLQSSYTLLIDGQSVATASPANGELNFSFSLAGLTEGYHKIDVGGLHADESVAAAGLYVNKGSDGGIVGNYLPVWSGTYSVENNHPHYYHYATVPPRNHAPYVLPLDPLELDRAPFSDARNSTGLVGVDYCQSKFGDLYIPNLDDQGVVVSGTMQNYFFEDFGRKIPRLPLLDGPRGVGTITFPTHLEISKREGSKKIYGCDSWRVFVVHEDGTVRTLAGWRHRNPPPHFENQLLNGDPVARDPGLELVGDWSAVPAERHGFWEPWAFKFDPRTFPLDTSTVVGDAPPEHPHVVGPAGFVADSRHNRLTKLQFLRDQRTPAVVTEFITGLSNPWAFEILDGKLYIGERAAHKITVWNADTGAFIETLVQASADYAYIDPGPNIPQARTNPGTGQPYTLADMRSQAIQAPEGLHILGDWLYFTSIITREVKRVHLTTKAVEFYLSLDPMFPDNNTAFLHLAMSDGTFGPYGTVFVATWSNRYGGRPDAFLPNGQRWDYLLGGGPPRGNGSSSVLYVSAVAVGKGLMVYGGAQEGLAAIGALMPWDKPPLPNVSAGFTKYQQSGFELTHGSLGWSRFGLGQPWSADGVPNTDSDTDNLLKTFGHYRIPNWRRNRRLLAWAPISGTTSNDPPSRLADSGAAIEDTTLWRGPGGSGTDNSDNSTASIDLIADAPVWIQRSAATASGQRTANASHYADGKPSARKVRASIEYSKWRNRIVMLGAVGTSGTGASSFSTADGLDPFTNTWDAAGTLPAAEGDATATDTHGDIYALVGSTMRKWDRVTGTQTVVGTFGSAAGGPLVFDTKRYWSFSLSYGDGEGNGTDVRAFRYTEEGSVRTAVTLTSLNGAIEQFVADAGRGAGMVYDPNLDACLWYDGRGARAGRVYAIRPNSGTTWTIEILALAAGSVAPAATVGNGIYSRIRYVSKLKGVVLYADGGAPLSFLPTGAA